MQYFLFTDIETGGLNGRLPNGQLGMEYYPIFEVAFIITDESLTPIGEPLRVVIHHSEEIIAKSHPWALMTHTESGLLEEVRNSTVTLSQAEDRVIAYLRYHSIEEYDRESKEGVILAGNSIMFDRTYFMAQMPLLHKFLHYRQLDVSGLGIAVGIAHPEQYEKVIQSKRGTHKALSDVEDCLEELRSYFKIIGQT